MEKVDNKSELKAGLEVHQQLDTGKLFCRCPSILRNDSPQFIVARKLNPVAGETGEIDVAAAHEKLKDKTFVYEVFDTNCLLELDECPPYEMDQEALKISLQIALLLNCRIFPVAQIMRKTVIDGSNTSGFQRGVLIAHDGFIETSKGKVGIETIALEEDACRPSDKKDEDLEEIGMENSKIWKLDRLGIPLVEITTKPDLKDAEQIKEAALKIGEILRACKVKRGIGTIRQDLNISIEKGNRVEIKGFQDPKIMIQTVEKEVKRQKKLIEIHEEIQAKKIKPFIEIIELTELFKETECRILKGKKVFGIKIFNFRGLFGKEFYENRRFGSEVSDYAKIHGVGGIIHSDENLEKYNLSYNDINLIKRKLDVKEDDAFILIADNKKSLEAIEEARKRILMEIDMAVPKEVRKANIDGSTSFLRPMPGSARMYPETDLPLLKISRQIINDAKENLPKLRTELKGYLQEFGLNEELVKIVLQENKFEEFKELLKVIDNANLIAKTLVLFPKEIGAKENKSKEEIEKILSFDLIEKVLSEVDKRISENDVKIVLQKIVQGEKLEQAIKKEKINLKEELQKLVREKPNLSANAYMGLIMAKFKGKISGKEVMDKLKELGIK